MHVVKLLIAVLLLASSSLMVQAQEKRKKGSLHKASANFLPPEKNGGVRNGPLMNMEHKVTSQCSKESLKLAIQDLMTSYEDQYPKGNQFLQRLAGIKSEKSPEFEALKKEALLANPLLAFDKILAVRSSAESHAKMGLMEWYKKEGDIVKISNGTRYSRNWESRASCGGPGAFDDELVVISIKTGQVKSVYKAEKGKFLGDVDLHFDADKLLFSSHTDKGELKKVPNTEAASGYAVYELKIDPDTGSARGKPRRLTPDMGWDVDNYDACYLPNGRVIFASTASYEGVPCVGGKQSVANLYLMDGDGANVRRLTFDQDASWHPSVMENGRVMYLRWEYTDSSHYFSRVLMTMNPDGTDQKAYYGSNSYWPNSMFFPRQIPGSHSKFVCTITGHHDNPKGGAMCLFDVSKGRHEADGAIQFILGRGKKVHPIVHDCLADANYDPKFYEPYPLSDKYFLVQVNRSIYLVDVFDNMLLLKDGDYFEPIPLQKRKMPPVIPDRVDLQSKEGVVMITDIYAGPGLEGVARGTVKALRVYRYEYGPRLRGGHSRMGMEAGWDAKQVIGTAPVEPDGSCRFKVPANTPFAMQPLDKDGCALQLMRSWTVAMPGEMLSCVGCHESANMPPPMKHATVMLRKPSTLEPFYGPVRGFSFRNEVQPVLQKHCVSCHNGSKSFDSNGRDRQGRFIVPDRVVGTGKNRGRKLRDCGLPDFSDATNAYTFLHPYVRRNGPEGDYHLLTPLEFHVDTSELFQMLRKGHHGVKLDKPGWDRLVAWADLNAPFRGSWTEAGAKPGILDRRMYLRKLYSPDDYNPEKAIPVGYTPGAPFITPPPRQKPIAGKPVQVSKIEKRTQKVDLGDGVAIDLTLIPAGSFSMGSNDESPMEQPVTRVQIAEPFYMATKEVTLKQYRRFDPDYLNGVYDMQSKDQIHRGYYMNAMKYPVIRVSWQKANEFCEWLSIRTGKNVKLPTEAQWEWAARAGGDAALSYGDVNADFSKHANLADVSLKSLAVRKSPGFELQDPRYNDGALHLAEVGKYRPNAFGLYDMHGNVAEWTRSDYKAYPYNESDGRDAGKTGVKKVVRGGSWHDRPCRSTSSYRLGFPDWQRVYDVGFRVVIETQEGKR